MTLFEKDEDYVAFERVLDEAHAREPLRVLGYSVMPNHWHMVVWPKRGDDRQVSEFFRWLTVTHTQRWHGHYHTSGSGHLYQGRLKSFPIESDEHLYAVLRYVERNPVRANLIERAETWRCSSAWRYCCGQERGEISVGRLAHRPSPRLAPSCGLKPRPNSTHCVDVSAARGPTGEMT